MSGQQDGWALASAALDFVMEHVRDSGEAPAAAQNVLLYGPPGTGKSYFAQTYGLESPGAAKTAGESHCRVYLTEDTPAVDLRGGPLPNGREWH